MPPPMQPPTITPVGENWPIRKLNYEHQHPSNMQPGKDQLPSQSASIGNKINPNFNKLPFLRSILQKEITRPHPMMVAQSPSVVMQYSPSVYESHTTISATMADQRHPAFESNKAVGTVTINVTPLPFLPTISSANVLQDVADSTMGPPHMTTDAYFSHYHQPRQPMKGPMYLIIEGHSKVKTYGQNDKTAQKHEPKIVPVQQEDDPVIRHVVSDNGPMVKHLHAKKEELKKDKKMQKKSKEASSMGSLLSFIDSSLGDFLKDKVDEDNQNRIVSESKEQTAT